MRVRLRVGVSLGCALLGACSHKATPILCDGNLMAECGSAKQPVCVEDPERGSAPLDRGWILAWSEEFDGTELDVSKWSIVEGPREYGGSLAYNSATEVEVQDGHLRLRSRRASMGGRDYVSGMVSSQGLFKTTYGRFEIRARLPGGQGLWPALWLMPEDNTWPPEIDIMELLGFEPTRVYMTNIWSTGYQKRSFAQSSFAGPDFTEDFHVFTVDWLPGELRWYIDGVERFRSTCGIPALPMYVILSTGVGGNWPGDPDASTPFPQYHDVDYVRVYQHGG